MTSNQPRTCRKSGSDILSNNAKTRTVAVKYLFTLFDLLRGFQGDQSPSEVSSNFGIVAFTLFLLLVSTATCIRISTDTVLATFGINNIAMPPSDCILTVFSLVSLHNDSTVVGNLIAFAEIFISEKPLA
jgi:hypothetical protein